MDGPSGWLPAQNRIIPSSKLTGGFPAASQRQTGPCQVDDDAKIDCRCRVVAQVKKRRRAARLLLQMDKEKRQAQGSSSRDSLCSAIDTSDVAPALRQTYHRLLNLAAYAMMLCAALSFVSQILDTATATTPPQRRRRRQRQRQRHQQQHTHSLTHSLTHLLARKKKNPVLPRARVMGSSLLALFNLPRSRDAPRRGMNLHR
ncbi:hypothetical protein JOL62DRAFT_202586 [Phyllosticta paracitricarpa]|uniref:Uncharacterized protein n=1 Tax=Phyllosticta paracitricarpa TaxID=2016321 RepID=A0ABR1N1H6_9PEZI